MIIPRSKSSKNRRKHERKVYSSREGSTHEDLGLIADLHEALTGVPGLLTEVSQVVRSLLELEQQQGLPELQVLTLENKRVNIKKIKIHFRSVRA